MPSGFYPPLPSPLAMKPERPIADLAGGIGAGQDIYNNALRGAVMRQAMEREQDKVNALKAFQQSGDPNVLVPAMQPEHAAMLKPRMGAAQLKMANEMVDYWNHTKAGVTFDNYPQYYADTIGKFPQARGVLTPPGLVKNAEDFEKLKWSYETKAAELKRLSGGVKMSGGYMYDPVREEVTTLPMRPIDRARVAHWGVTEGQREEALRQKAEGGGGRNVSRGRIPGYSEWSANPENTGKSIADYNQEVVSPYYTAMEEGKKGGKGGKVYSQAEQDKIVGDSISKDLAFPGSDLATKLKGKSAAEQDSIIEEERRRRRSVYGFGKGSAATAPPAKQPSAGANKGKYWTTEDGRIFQSDGSTWTFIKSVR